MNIYNVPTSYQQLQPKVSNLSTLQEKEQKIRKGKTKTLRVDIMLNP